jgi:hypothetical protein
VPTVPANDGRRSYDDHGIAPIEESGEQCEAYSSRVIRASGLDATLDVTRKLLAKNQVLSADRTGRVQEREDQPQDVRGYPDDCSRQQQHVLIMPESERVCRYRTRTYPRRESLRTTPLPTAIRTSCVPRLRISVITGSQNLTNSSLAIRSSPHIYFLQAGSRVLLEGRKNGQVKLVALYQRPIAPNYDESEGALSTGLVDVGVRQAFSM